MHKVCISILILIVALDSAKEPMSGPQFQSPFMRVELAPDQPALTVLTVDSLGTKKLTKNPLRPPVKPDKRYEVRYVGRKFEYRSKGEPTSAPVWSFEFSERQIRLHSSYSQGNPPSPLVLNFNTFVNHATLLGLMNEDGSVHLPALLHLPDQGTFRIASRTGKSSRSALTPSAFLRGTIN